MNYYIVGSKYNRGDHYENIFRQMVDKDAVSVGFAAKHDLTHLYQKDENEIAQYLKGVNEDSYAIAALKRFLNLKPGDFIAIKGSGSPVGEKPRLIIVGYAVVVERDGLVYQHDPDGLGHLINVEFLETSLEKEFELGYGRTIHKLENQEHAELIFGLYYQISSHPEVKKKYSGTERKITEKQLRYRQEGYYVVENAHNKLQQKLYDFLKKKHSQNVVVMEEDFVDIKLVEDDIITFYEVKPFLTARRCIREALGQILDYSWFVASEETKQIKLIIVGPNEPNNEEEKFISYVKSNLNMDFDYIAFNFN